MKIKLKEIPIREIVKNYTNKSEEGVFGYDGKLNIRPPYQREFIYNGKQRDLVIDSVTKGLPLNVMYWSKNEDGTYEVLDGQQRTISICEYVTNNFSINDKYFHSLTEDEKSQILNYKLMIYITEGTEKEKLEWFQIINISGEKLTNQELRNAIYTGPWLTSAKEIFSKTGGPAQKKYNTYLIGNPIRQDYLETALKWISDFEGISIEEYMSYHQFDENAASLWQYIQSVMSWVEITFPEYRREMKGIDWGILYNKYKDNSVNSITVSEDIKQLMIDDDVTNKRGIYEYILSGDERYLNIRKFSESIKRSVYERQDGKCNICGGEFDIKDMDADHIIPWSKGGKTTEDNCQMLCKPCNRDKSDK